MIFCWLEAILTDRLCRKSTSKKKIQKKDWYYKVPNKRGAPLIFFEKNKSLILEFSSLAPKKIEQGKIYVSIQNSNKMGKPFVRGK